MQEDEYTRLRKLFERLDGLPPREREAALAELDLSPEARAFLDGLLADEVALDAFRDSELGAAGRALVSAAAAPGDPSRVVRIGRYDVERLLGEGGMGVVYACRDSQRDRPSAVKVIRPGLGSSLIEERFRREGALLEQLDHPGIAAFHEAGRAVVETDDGQRSTQWFLAMELVRGEPIGHYAESNDLGASARIELIADACDALHHAHQRGVIHRDLKPQNVLVEKGVDPSSPGQPKIVDFGIAHGEESATLTGTGDIIGSTRYMSPEQVVGGAKGLDARTDVYSLAVVLFELLTGALPYPVRGQSLPQVARTILEDEPTKLGSIDTRFRGSPLELVLAKALEKSPTRRYAEMASFRDDLKRFLTRRAVEAAAPPLPQRILRFARRHTLAVAVMAALLVGSVSTTVFAVRAVSARERAETLAYGASLAAANGELDRFDRAGAEFFLDQAPELLRGWEWEYMRAQLDDSERSVATEGSGYRGLFFATKGNTVHALHAHGATRLLAAACQLETIDFDRGEVLSRRDFPERGYYTLDRERLISTLPTLRSEAPANGELWFEHELDSEDWAIPTAFARGAPIVAIRRDGRVLVEGFEIEARVPLISTTVRIAVGPEADWVVVGDQLGRLTWWSLVNPGQSKVLQAESSPVIRALAVSEDGRMLASGGDRGELTLWTASGDEASFVRVRRLVDHSDSIGGLAFSANGRYLVSGGEDRAVRIWDVESGRLLQTFVGHRNEVQAVAIRDDARYVASAAQGEARLWAFDGSDPRSWVRPTPMFSTLGPNGRRLYCADWGGDLSIYDVESGVCVADWRPPWMSGELPAQALATNGRWLVVSNGNAEPEKAGVRVFDLTTGTLAATLLEGAEGAGWRTAVTRDGQWVAGYAGERGVRLWRTSDWQVVAEAPGTGGHGFLVFSPDDELLVTSRDGDMDVRRADDLSIVRTLPGPDAMAIFPSFSPDGSLLAAPCLDGTVRVWDVDTGRERFSLAEPGSVPWVALIWPSRGRIVSGGRDGALTFWDLEDGKRLFSKRHHQDLYVDLSLSPDGETLYTGAADGTVRVWETQPLSVRNEARRRYRAAVLELEPVVDEVLAAEGREGAARALAERSGWSEREREIAAQILLGRLFGRTER